MISNSKLTIYHKIIDKDNLIEKWIRFNYDNIWAFFGKNVATDKGYDNENNITIRIPYNDNNISIDNINVGDIIVPEKLDIDITKQKDLKGHNIFNITSINNNNFGNNPHIHISGK